MAYERKYYKDINYHPFMFFIIFGVSENELVISKERHHIDEVPDGLDMRIITRDKQKTYMDNICSGAIEKVLRENQPELYDRIKTENTWAIVSGEIVHDDNLKYMKNTIGVIQAFLDTGATGVLDMQTFTLYSKDEFESKIFSKELDVYSQVKILISAMEDGKIWLHTRGLRKFGRPDVSIEGIDNEDVDNAVAIANQMIFYSAQGVLFDREVNLHPFKDKSISYVVKPEFIEDYDNIDFNNAYCKLLWDECKKDESVE